MNKPIKNILILFIVLVSLVMANILLNVYIDRNANEISEETIQSVYITNYSVDIVEKIEIENEFGKIALVKENEQWYIQGNEEAELDQGVVYELAYMVTHIMADITVSEAEDTEDVYGMLAPSSIITTYYEGMAPQSVTIGDKSPIENQYYLQSSVFRKVYTVDMAYYIYGNIKLEDLLLIKGVNIEHANMKEIKIKNSLSEEFTIRRTLPENDITLCYWEFIEPFCHDIDTAVMYGSSKYTGMITTIVELTGEKVIAIGENEASKYGLDKPLFSADILAESGEMQSFSIGEYGDAENYSLKFSGDGNIYSIAKEKVPFIDYSAFTIAEANLDLINIDVVENVAIDLPDMQINIYIVQSTVKNIDGSTALDADGNLITENMIYIDNLYEEKNNSSNINDQKLLFYQDVVTIKIDDLSIEGIEAGEKIGSILFSLNSEYKDEVMVEFFEYSNSHYIARKNGEEALYLVNKEQIDRLSERYQLLLDGNLDCEY
ncbi:MAG: DUF4340 domain-containing protein [Eubacteriales bacterium]